MIDVRHLKDRLLVRFHSAAFLDPEAVGKVNAEIERHLPEMLGKSVVVDLSNLEYFSSQVIGILILMHRQIQQCGKVMTVRNLKEESLEVYRMTGLHNMFPLDTHTDDE